MKYGIPIGVEQELERRRRTRDEAQLRESPALVEARRLEARLGTGDMPARTPPETGDDTTRGEER